MTVYFQTLEISKIDTHAIIDNEFKF